MDRKSPFIRAIFCAVLTFSVSFFAVPILSHTLTKIFNASGGRFTDIFWILPMMILSVLFAVVIFKKINYKKPFYILYTLPFQMILLWILIKPISELWGIGEGILMEIEYIGFAFPIVILVSLTQTLAVFVLSKFK